MDKGSGAPYIRVYTSLGEITSKITSFSYKYSQEEDDTCQLRVEEKDVNLPDRVEFQEGAILKVVWGYLGESIKQTREVTIRNIKPSYIETTITLDLLCTDRVSRFKSTSSKKVHKGTIQDIAKDIAKRNGCTVKGFGDDGSIDVLDVDVRKPSYFEDNGNLTSAVDNVVVVKPLVFKIYESLPQANKSDYQVLREAADNDPNGPWEVTGRDNTLIVNPINFNQKPQRAYVWEGGDGELLQFQPETKNYTRHQASSNVTTEAFNPHNKSAYTINSNEQTNNITKLGDTNEAPPRFSNNGMNGASSSEAKIMVVGPNKVLSVSGFPDVSLKNGKLVSNAAKPVVQNQGNVKQLGKGSNTPVNSEVVPDDNFKINPADDYKNNQSIKGENGVINYKVIDPTEPAFLNSMGNFTTAVATTAVVFPIKPIAIDYNQHIPTEEHSVEDAYAKAKNSQAIAAMKKNPAEIKVVGYSLLQSGKIITILNASKKYSGNYYIVECTHTITPGGYYYVEMKGRRNALGRTNADTPTKWPVTTFDNIPGLENKTGINKELGPSNNQTEQNIPLNQVNSTDPLASPGVF